MEAEPGAISKVDGRVSPLGRAHREKRALREMSQPGHAIQQSSFQSTSITSATALGHRDSPRVMV